MSTWVSFGFVLPILWSMILLWNLQIQGVHGSGVFQLTLMSYQFEYEGSRGGSTTSSPQITIGEVALPADYAKSYKPEWKLSGVFNLEPNPDTVANQENATNNGSVIQWPWTESTECSSLTQYRFVLCLDYAERFDPQRPCALERIQTQQMPIDRTPFPPSVMGREIVTFENLLGTRNRDVIPNPLSIEFPEWKGPLRISVYINCCAANQQYQGQCKEALTTTMTSWPRPFVEGTQTMRFLLSGRGSLTISANAVCDPHSFGKSCDIPCRVNNSALSHMFCNSSTGLKQCLAGWSGPDCQTDVDECQNIMCQNAGTCQNTRGSFNCICPLGTRGRFCEQRYPTCHLKPCQHQGTCLDTSAGTVCFCMPGFGGQWCHLLEGQEEKVDPGLAGVIAGQPTTPRSATSPTTAPPDVKVQIESTAATGKETGIQWHSWYLALILGILLILALLIVLMFFVYKAKVKKRYKVTAPLPPPPPANSSPSPQTKTRGFNNAAYQVDDPANIIQPSSFQIFYNSNNIASSSAGRDHGSNVNDISNVSQQHAGNDKDEHWKVDFSDKIMITSRVQGMAASSSEVHGKMGGPSQSYEMKDLKSKLSQQQKMASASADAGFDASMRKKSNKNESKHGRIDYTGNGQLEKPAKYSFSDDDEDDDFGFTKKGMQLNKGPQATPQSLLDQGSGWIRDVIGQERRAHLPSTPGRGVESRNGHSKEVQRQTDDKNRSQKYEDHQIRGGIGNMKGSEYKPGSAYTGFGKRHIEHEYEEIDTEHAFQPYKPRPKPRSILNVKSETLRRKDPMSIETMPVRMGHRKFEAKDDRYETAFPIITPRPGDPSIVLGVRRGSDGCITESTHRPFSVRYDYPRHSDGSINYNPDHHYNVQVPPQHNDQNGFEAGCDTFSNSIKSPYVNASADIFSTPQSQDVFGNTGNPLNPTAAARTRHPFYANIRDVAHSMDASPTSGINDRQSHYAHSNGTRGESAVVDRDSQPLYGNSPMIPATRLNSRGYVSSMDVMHSSGMSDPDFQTSRHADSPSSFKTPGGNQGRRRSEPFAGKLFRRSRMVELNGDRESAVDVDWWEDDSDIRRENFSVDPAGAYAVSSFV